jgi:TM2 domain-containing membrane protein YozV
MIPLEMYDQLTVCNWSPINTTILLATRYWSHNIWNNNTISTYYWPLQKYNDHEYEHELEQEQEQEHEHEHVQR